jgi:hypothetical protein
VAACFTDRRSPLLVSGACGIAGHRPTSWPASTCPF